jgi:hypothetical protein
MIVLDLNQHIFTFSPHTRHQHKIKNRLNIEYYLLSNDIDMDIINLLFDSRDIHVFATVPEFTAIQTVIS